MTFASGACVEAVAGKSKGENKSANPVKKGFALDGKIKRCTGTTLKAHMPLKAVNLK